MQVYATAVKDRDVMYDVMYNVIVAHTTVVYQQRPQPQTVVVRDRRSHGMGNMTTGMTSIALFTADSVLTDSSPLFQSALFQ